MDLSILSLLAQATLVAKAVLVVLLFMSVFSWALMFRKWMNIRAALKKAADGITSSCCSSVSRGKTGRLMI